MFYDTFGRRNQSSPKDLWRALMTTAMNDDNNSFDEI